LEANPADRSRRLLEEAKTKDEFESAVNKMTDEERQALYCWLRHEDDQRYAKVVQRQEEYEEWRKGVDVLEAHGFGQPGKETLRQVWPTLSHEEQLVVVKSLEIMTRDAK
jgi:hypothetical protein